MPASRSGRLHQTSLQQRHARVCVPAHRRDDVLAELRIGQQESPVVPLSCDVLRASQVEINGVTFVFDMSRSSHHRARVVATKLCDQRSVFLIIYTVEALCPKLA